MPDPASPIGEGLGRSFNVTTATSLISGLQDKLGLKLDSTRAHVEVLVIDHVEKPTEN